MMLMHSKNILHRDLKLQNIFLSADNTLKLGDFGVARECDESVDLAATICGTPYYTAPEITRGEKYGSKADIFSLGIALYEICTFELPFFDSEKRGLIDKIANQLPPPITGNYDDECKDIIFEMLAKDPGARPSVFNLFEAQFIRDRVTKWSLADSKIKAYVDGMVNVNKPSRTNKAATKAKSVDPIATQENANYFCENPTILVAALMGTLTINNVQTGYFGTPEPVFSGVDMYNCLKRIGAFELADEKLVDQMCKF
jgi:serine/threonine protein kinase